MSSLSEKETSSIHTARETVYTSRGRATSQRRPKAQKSREKKSKRGSRSKASLRKRGQLRMRNTEVDSSVEPSARASSSDDDGEEGRDEEREKSRLSSSETLESQLQQLSLDEEDACDKGEYGKHDVYSTIVKTEETIEVLQQLRRDVDALAKEEGSYLADKLDTVAEQTRKYGEAMLNPDAAETMAKVQAHLVAAALARRTYAAELEAKIIQPLTEFNEEIKAARAQVRKIDLLRKNVDLAKKMSGKSASNTSTPDEKQLHSEVEALVAFQNKAASLITDLSEQLSECAAALHAALSSNGTAETAEEMLGPSEKNVESASGRGLLQAAGAHFDAKDQTVVASRPSRALSTQDAFGDTVVEVQLLVGKYFAASAEEKALTMVDLRSTFQIECVNALRSKQVVPTLKLVTPDSDGSLCGLFLIFRMQKGNQVDSDDALLLSLLRPKVVSVQPLRLDGAKCMLARCCSTKAATQVVSAKVATLENGHSYLISRPRAESPLLTVPVVTEQHVEWAPLHLDADTTLKWFEGTLSGSIVEWNESRHGISIDCATEDQAALAVYLLRGLSVDGIPSRVVVKNLLA